MSNQDRVNDLYYGRIHSPEAQEACRARVHWLCEHSQGPRVLDLGCSQGIASIILAREGCTVVGLDIEAPAIAAAREAIGNETPEVQQRVTFQVADAFTAEFEPASFDTVIMGELLEHLATPERLLERVCQWLRPGGRAVISVPHGYEPFPDHKRSFYVQRLVTLLARVFELESIEPVHSKYLCAAGVRTADERKPQSFVPERLAEWLQRCEDALEHLQRAEHKEKLALQDGRQQLSERAAELREHIEKLKQASNELREQVRAGKAELREQRERERVEHALLDRQVQALGQRGREAAWREREAQKRERQAVAQAKTLEAASNKARQRVAQLEADLKTLRQSAAQLSRLQENEKRQRRRIEAQLEHARSQAEFYKLELTLREQEVRYRLGDSFVRAARPSLDTLKLPFRVVSLLFEGLRRRRARREAEKGRRRAAAPPPSAAQLTLQESKPEDAAKDTRPHSHDREPARAETGLDHIPSLIEPFSGAPPELQRRPGLHVAAVTDEFSWRAWQFEADVYTFTPKTWREVLEERRPDLLLVESAWSGIGDTWYFQIRDLGKRSEVIKHYAIPEIVAWCRRHSIPTVFYNKEDPPNFDVFIEAAKQFDHVFTSDANCIADYRKHLGHERVFAIPFAAQPRIHNPVMSGSRTGSVCFAGTWYAHRHLSRHSSAEAILRPALDYDLHIFDRRANSGNPNYRWPDAFLPAVRGALPYAQMLAAYKRYKVFLNINSVTDSPTMFSRRVFELLACGTPVISAYSEGIEVLLGGDVVLMSEDAQTTRTLLERVLSDDEYRERLALRGQRKVFCEHTYAHRLEAVLKAVGLAVEPVGRPLMTMVAAIEQPSQVPAAWETFSRQTYENKQLILCARQAEAVKAVDGVTSSSNQVRVAVADNQPWGQLFGQVLGETGDGFVVALNPQHHYGPDYLTDYANATLYVTEPAIGKASFYQAAPGTEPKVVNPGREYRPSGRANPWTLCLPVAQARQAATQQVGAQSPEEWWNRAMRACDRIYSADRFNFVQIEAPPAEPGESTSAPSRFEPSEADAMKLALV
jgi:spore maturation protein CgeB/2-polyprenyl-3-methyl-5-hydroxy-6-metoxy-1,4-benzoquinol methylase/septal ring factor EnvC (AmiA/AmiB activator)